VPQGEARRHGGDKRRGAVDSHSIPFVTDRHGHTASTRAHSLRGPGPAGHRHGLSLQRRQAYACAPLAGAAFAATARLGSSRTGSYAHTYTRSTPRRPGSRSATRQAPQKDNPQAQHACSISNSSPPATPAAQPPRHPKAASTMPHAQQAGTPPQRGCAPQRLATREPGQQVFM
jgi:hypothetical protein